MTDITFEDKVQDGEGDLGDITVSDVNAIKAAVNSKQDVLAEGAFADGDMTALDVLVASRSVTPIASGSQAQGTAEIADGACASPVTVSAAGVVTTDIVDWGYNETPIGKTGYDPTAGEELSIRTFPTTDNINILVCNRTGSAVTPAAMTVNYRVVRWQTEPLLHKYILML